jgi:hypothetical protein
MVQDPSMKRDTEEPDVVWGDYVRLEPGNYQAYCKRANWYWDPSYKRWTCLLLFDVLATNLNDSLGTIPLWFNGGDKDKPRAGRRGLYLSEWVRANGGPPVRKDRLSPKVFIKRMAHIQVGDTKGSMPYSVVRQILNWNTG